MKRGPRLFLRPFRSSAHRLVWLLDPNVAALVWALNRWPGLKTVSSCGGHPDPSPVQYAAGNWYVSFRVASSASGLASLRRLAWLVNNRAVKQGRSVFLYPYARRPSGQRPADQLLFILEGYDGEDPVAVAQYLEPSRATPPT